MSKDVPEPRGVFMEQRGDPGEGDPERDPGERGPERSRDPKRGKRQGSI